MMQFSIQIAKSQIDPVKSPASTSFHFVSPCIRDDIFRCLPMRLTGLAFETVRFADILSAEASIYVLLRCEYYGEGSTVLVSVFFKPEKRRRGDKIV